MNSPLVKLKYKSVNNTYKLIFILMCLKLKSTFKVEVKVNTSLINNFHCILFNFKGRIACITIELIIYFMHKEQFINICHYIKYIVLNPTHFWHYKLFWTIELLSMSPYHNSTTSYIMIVITLGNFSTNEAIRLITSCISEKCQIIIYMLYFIYVIV